MRGENHPTPGIHFRISTRAQGREKPRKHRVVRRIDRPLGKSAGLKAFFAHTERPMREMADLLKSGRYADEIMIRKPAEALATPR